MSKVIPVKVAFKARPLIKKELDEKTVDCLTYIEEANQVIVNGKAFTYDYLFTPKNSQQELFEGPIKPLVDGIFKGYNGTVLAYGQTGAGKTYSMGSAHCVSEASVLCDSSGVIPRVINDIFERIQQQYEYEHLLKVQYAEIYMEEIKDLLAPDEQKNHTLNIRETREGGVIIAGITEKVVQSPEETLHLMESGNQARATGSTAMNSTSSRSHAIFTITLEAKNVNDQDDFTTSKFHLVDLAGSERVKKTKAEGERLQEGIKINAGLLALGNVISALGDPCKSRAPKHVPYRDSKLTRLLQDSLGGNSMTVMIACVSPAETNTEETLNTCRYADRARKIKNKAVVNRDPITAEVTALRKENRQLKLQLSASGNVGGVNSEELESTKHQLQELHSENRKLTGDLRTILNFNTNLSEKLLFAEGERDLIKEKLQELQESARSVEDAHSISILKEKLENMKEDDDIEMHLKDFDTLKMVYENVLDITTAALRGDGTATTTSTTINADEEGGEVFSKKDATSNDHNGDGDDEDDDVMNTAAAGDDSTPEEMEREHILRTAQLSSKLNNLQERLQLKEDLVRKLSVPDDDLSAIKEQYESRIVKLDRDIKLLQKEKEDFKKKLEIAEKSKTKTKKTKEDRAHLQKLEQKIKELMNERKEKEKMSKMKKQADEKVGTLLKEISTMKAARVDLHKKIRAESTRFLSLKKEKEREVKQLQSKERKNKCEIARLERNFSKQQMVLRRKTEEAAATSKRLKEALMKQKSVAKQRLNSAANQSQMKESAENMRWKSWIEEDLELKIRMNDAKKQLAILVNDYKGIQDQLKELDSKEAALRKNKKNRRRTLLEQEVNETRRVRCSMKEEASLKDGQIRELQEELYKSRDHMGKQSSRWQQISSVGDMRNINRHLFKLLAESREGEEGVRKQMSDLRSENLKFKQTENELSKEKADLEVKIESNELEFTKRAVQLESNYQEKIKFLTMQLNESMNEHPQTSHQDDSATVISLKSKLKIQGDVIHQQQEEIDEKQKRLEQMEMEVNSLRDGILLQPRKTRKRASTDKQHMSYEEFFNNVSDDEQHNDVEGEDSDGSEYVPTPKVIRRNRRTMLNRKAPPSNLLKLPPLPSDDDANTSGERYQTASESRSPKFFDEVKEEMNATFDIPSSTAGGKAVELNSTFTTTGASSGLNSTFSKEDKENIDLIEGTPMSMKRASRLFCEPDDDGGSPSIIPPALTTKRKYFSNHLEGVGIQEEQEVMPPPTTPGFPAKRTRGKLRKVE